MVVECGGLLRACVCTREREGPWKVICSACRGTDWSHAQDRMTLERGELLSVHASCASLSIRPSQSLHVCVRVYRFARNLTTPHAHTHTHTHSHAHAHTHAHTAVAGKHCTFKEAVWLSIQTQDTIGFGALFPNSMWANWVMFAQSFTSLVSYALLTGLTFAKVGRFCMVVVLVVPLAEIWCVYGCGFGALLTPFYPPRPPTLMDARYRGLPASSAALCSRTWRSSRTRWRGSSRATAARRRRPGLTSPQRAPMFATTPHAWCLGWCVDMCCEQTVSKVVNLTRVPGKPDSVLFAAECMRCLVLG